MTKYCCICEKKIKGFGNNPDPVKTSGVCCDSCNVSKVIPARISAHFRAMGKNGGKKSWEVRKKLLDNKKAAAKNGNK